MARKNESFPSARAVLFIHYFLPFNRLSLCERQEARRNRGHNIALCGVARTGAEGPLNSEKNQGAHKLVTTEMPRPCAAIHCTQQYYTSEWA